MTLSRTEPIKLMSGGAFSIYSKIRPLYGGSDKITLQELLQGCDLPFNVSSTLVGEIETGLLVTLEEFLIQSNLPQGYKKTIKISFSNDESIDLVVRKLYVENDVLYMEVISSNSKCERINNELVYPVSNITSLELEGGQIWKQ